MPAAVRDKGLRQAAVVLLVAAATTAGLALLGQKRARQERDLYAILDQVAEIETRLRAGDAGVWRLFEDDQPPDSPDRHHGNARIIQDMERLAHLEDLRLRDAQVEVQGDTAQATYLLDGRGSIGGEPIPSGGQLAFRRAGEVWRPYGHAFVYATASAPLHGRTENRRPPAAAHRHVDSHERLATRLAAIASLALMASLACLVWPWAEARLVSQRGRPGLRAAGASSRVGKKRR